MVTRPKKAAEIAAMREGGKMLASTLTFLSQRLEPGQSTYELARLAESELARLGGEPSFLNYQGFPEVICISINDEVVHGIPRKDRVVESGDIVSLDFGVTYRGLITDSAISLIAGKPQAERQVKLVADTALALEKGISAVKDNARTGDIGHAIENFLKKSRYGIVRDLVGHGVGHDMHEDPNIPNYGRAGTGPWLSAGLTVAIEPMVTLGGDRVFIAADGWTVKTADGSRAAHFEHTVLVTESGAEILTKL